MQCTSICMILNSVISTLDESTSLGKCCPIHPVIADIGGWSKTRPVARRSTHESTAISWSPGASKGWKEDDGHPVSTPIYFIWNAWLDDDDDDDDHYSYVLSTRIGSLVYDDFDDCPQFCPRWWAMVMSDDFHKYGNPKNIIKAPYRCSTVLYIHNVAYMLAKLDLVKAAWSTNNRKVIFKSFHWTGSI